MVQPRLPCAVEPQVAQVAQVSGESDEGDAFERLLGSGEGPLLRYLFARLDTPAQAHELAQETLVRAFCALREGARPLHPVPWLLGIARHVLLETWRGERYQRRLRERLARVMGPGWAGAPDDLGAWWSRDTIDTSGVRWQERVERRLVVGEAVEGLPPELRAPVLLHYFGGLPLAEVATHLATTPGAIKMRLLRARLALRARLEDPEAGRGTEEAMSERKTGRRPGTRGARVAPQPAAARLGQLAPQPTVYDTLGVGLEVGGRRYATDPLSEPVFSGEGLSLEELRWATERLHAVRLAGPRPLAGTISFWAAPDPFEHSQPAAVWSWLREAETAPPEFELIPTDGWRLGTDPHWRTVLEDLQRAGLRHVWLTFAGLEATHDDLAGRPGAFAAAVRSLERARDVGLSKGANLIISTRSTGELAELTRLVYSFREAPAGPRGVSVYVPHWYAISPAYEALRPQPEDLAGLPPADLAHYWRQEAFWVDLEAHTEAALTRAAVAGGPGAGRRPAGTAAGGAEERTEARSLSLLVTARMELLVGQPYMPPMQRVANLRRDTPEQVYERLAALESPPAVPSDAELAERYGDLASRKVYMSLDGLRPKWVHAWRLEQGQPRSA
ncbi:MAG TPA: sigma factor-like helix-turn-helix DNA-binding protein [Chloroflexota bacterium]|nr:sigma factor-like helix-turn-helix DNA-binding protein [Chloroflexota bacterium]